MDLKETVAALTAFVVALTALIPVVIKLWHKVSKQARILDDFWASHLLRGKTEAMVHDLAVEYFDTSSYTSPDSEGGFMPMALRARAYKLFDDKVKTQLQAVRERNPDASETEMAQLIERRFGGWLARNICLKLGINQFACIVMAISVADGIPPVPDSNHD